MIVEIDYYGKLQQAAKELDAATRECRRLRRKCEALGIDITIPKFRTRLDRRRKEQTATQPTNK